MKSEGGFKNTRMTSGLFSSVKGNWETPQDFFKQMNKEFDFTLDSCADETNHKVDNYFDEHTNALINPWPGRVWCNPPYGRNLINWVMKAYMEAQTGRAEVVVLLIPSRTDTKWFHDYCLRGEIRFVRGRLQFGESHDNAPFPSMIVIFRRPPQ